MVIFIKKNNKDSNNLIKFCIFEYAKLFSIDLDNFDIIREEGKKPILSIKKINFNLSHSGIYTLIAVSNENVGIDIQKHYHINFKEISTRFFHKNEICQTQKEFFDLWAKKESYIKLFDMNFFDCLSSKIDFTDTKQLEIINNYSIAVSGKDKEYKFFYIV